MPSRKTTKRRQGQQRRLRKGVEKRLGRLRATARCSRDERCIARLARRAGIVLEPAA